MPEQKGSRRDEAGQGSAEYALLTSAVVVMVVAATVMFGEDVSVLFTRIGAYITTAVL